MTIKATFGALLLAGAGASSCTPSTSQEMVQTVLDHYPQKQQQPYFDFAGHENIYAFLVNGDPWEAQHIRNIMRAEEVLQEIGVPPENMYSVSRRFRDGQRLVPSSVHAYSGRTTSLELALQEVQEKVQENDIIFFSVTGHGVEGQSDCIAFSKNCYKIDTLIEKLSFMKEKNISGIFLFDHCHSGNFAEKIIDSGISAKFMSPGEGDELTMCQYFTPFFWAAVEKGVDYNNNGRATFFDAFRFAMTFYRNKTGTAGNGTYRETIPELTLENYDTFMRTGYPLVIDITATWCGPCQKMQPEIDKLKSRYGDNLAIVKITEDDGHGSDNPEYQQLVDRLGIKVRALPTLVFMQGNRVETQIGYKTADQLSDLVQSSFALSWKGIEDVQFEEKMENAYTAYYAILAGSALVLGAAWVLYRKRRKG